MLPKDKIFAKAALEKGFITSKILNECLAYLQNNPQQLTVQDYLYKSGFMTLEQITLILKELRYSSFDLNTDRYQVLEKIGQGGMGSVYKVQDTKLQRTVALKTISLNNDKNSQQRFLQEARVMASLKHPNILNIIDLGTYENGSPYFTMDYIEGQTLTDKRFSRRKAILVTIEICKAMQYAHDKGIIHRDLKPSNIMFTDNTPIVMDFGLAKINYDDKKLSKTGEIIGTVQYMPPEQALGRNADIDHCSDVYSLGAVLFYLLAGKAPFAGGSSISVIFQLTQEQIKFPQSKRIPQELQNICLKAMAKEKKDRYQSAAEFAQDLGNFLEGKNVEAHKEKQIARFKQSAVMLFIICSVLFSGWFISAKIDTSQSISHLRSGVEVLFPKRLSQEVIHVDKPSFHIHLQIKEKTSISLWINSKEALSIPPKESSRAVKGRILLAYGKNDVAVKLWHHKKWVTIYTIPVIYHSEKNKLLSSIAARNNIYKTYLTDNLINEHNIRNICSPASMFDKTLYTCGHRQNLDYALITFDENLKSRWLYNLDSPISSAPLVVDKLLYFGTKKGDFYCLNIENDNIVVSWKAKLSKEALDDTPIFSNGLVYVSDGTACYAFSMSTGEKKWKIPGQEQTSPAIFDGILYIGDSQKISAVSKGNGKILWQKPTTVHSTLCVTSKGIFYHSSTKVHALDLKGNKLWESSLKSSVRQKFFHKSALVYQGLVYWSAITQIEEKNTYAEIYAFDNQNGDIKWQTILEFPVQSSPVLVEIEKQNLIFVNSDHGFVYAINSNNGKKVLQYKLYPENKNRDKTISYPPIISDGKIYIPCSFKMQVRSLSHFIQNYQVTEVEENSIEAEHFKIPQKFISNMSHWGTWSNGKQCFWQKASEGKKESFGFFVQEAGEYQIKIDFTSNKRYGKFEISINRDFTTSQSLVFDLYQKKRGYSVITKDLGKHLLTKGKNSLIVTCVGCNKNAKNPYYRFGFDKITLTPIKQNKSSFTPTLYLPFDQDFKNHSNFNNKIINKNVILTPGKKGNCAQFNGKSYLRIFDNPRINFRQKFTFSLWLYHENTTRPLPILSKRSNNQNLSYGLVLNNQTSTLQLCFPNSYLLTPIFILPQKEWYMFTVTYDGSEAKFYLNGKWKNTILFRSTVPISHNDLLIGSYSGLSEKFIGKMDELHIFDRVLTPKEVKNLHFTTK